MGGQPEPGRQPDWRSNGVPDTGSRARGTAGFPKRTEAKTSDARDTAVTAARVIQRTARKSLFQAAKSAEQQAVRRQSTSSEESEYWGAEGPAAAPVRLDTVKCLSTKLYDIL